MSKAFIGIIIAGIGVIVRHYIITGNANAGFIASGMCTVILVPILKKSLKKYNIEKKNL